MNSENATPPLADADGYAFIQKRPYIFRRSDCFYVVLDLCSHAQARKNAECNPGTVKVETVEGEVVWESLNRP